MSQLEKLVQWLEAEMRDLLREPIPPGIVLPLLRTLGDPNPRVDAHCVEFASTHEWLPLSDADRLAIVFRLECALDLYRKAEDDVLALTPGQTAEEFLAEALIQYWYESSHEWLCATIGLSPEDRPNPPPFEAPEPPPA